MDHLAIAYEVLVLMIGLVALSFSLPWAARTGEPYRWYFWAFYGLFTVFVAVSVLKKYVFLNISDFPMRARYVIYGISSSMSYPIVYSSTLFFHGVYRLRRRRALAVFFGGLMVLYLAAVIPPFGASLQETERAIRLGPGFLAAALVYELSFAYTIVIGGVFLHRIRETGLRIFIIGLLIFAVVGFMETAGSLIGNFSHPLVPLESEPGGFLFSTIPYGLYGLFLIVYFMRGDLKPVTAQAEAVDRFRTRYGISERENEIILGVLRGKNNAEIGKELFISVATVKSHLHTVFRKSGARSRYGLIHKIRTE